MELKTTKSGGLSIQPTVFWISAVLITGFVLWGVLASGSLSEVSGKILGNVSAQLGWFFITAANIFLNMKNEILQLKFEKGNILIQTKTKHPFLEQFNWLNYDLRTQSYRCFGYYYKDLILALQKNLDYKDSIKAYQELSLKLTLPFEKYSYQKEAMKKWSEQKRGILVLPTGSGKSILAAMIMEKINRSTLVLVPTIELLIQWHKNIFHA